MISIIIPTYNQETFLRRCIESIRRFTAEPYEVIVVDNGSQDGTLAYCRNQRLMLVSLPNNRGFPAACNVGLQVASSDRLLLLNDDTEAVPHWLTEMNRCLDAEEDIGMVGPMTNYAGGSQRLLDDSGDAAAIAERLHREQEGEVQEVRRLVGFCLLLKRSVLDKIGLLDEAFGRGHYEDDDYCYRARLAGYRMMIARGAYVHHHGSQSFQRWNTDEWEQLIEKNRQVFVQKWGFDPRQMHAAES